MMAEVKPMDEKEIEGITEGASHYSPEVQEKLWRAKMEIKRLKLKQICFTDERCLKCNGIADPLVLIDDEVWCEVCVATARAEKAEADYKNLSEEFGSQNAELAKHIVMFDEATTRAETAEADLAEVEKDRDKQHQQAQDAAHVLTRIPLAHEDLNVCGCAMCERVRAAMVDTGYLELATEKDGE